MTNILIYLENILYTFARSFWGKMKQYSYFLSLFVRIAIIKHRAHCSLAVLHKYNSRRGSSEQLISIRTQVYGAEFRRYAPVCKFQCIPSIICHRNMFTKRVEIGFRVRDNFLVFHT